MLWNYQGQGAHRWQITTIYYKTETSFMTISLEAMMLSCAIDTKEERYITVTNIPRAFLHANINEDVHIILDGGIAEPILKLEPKLYRNLVWSTVGH